AGLSELYESVVDKFPIAFLEDPFGEEDWNAFVSFTARVNIEVVGDDLLCTNPEIISAAIKDKAVNSLLLKPNQIGTLTEAIEAVRLAKSAGWAVMASHRSGETTDDFIAEMSVGLATGRLKSGATCRGERLAKYNQLLRIEEELGSANTPPTVCASGAGAMRPARGVISHGTMRESCMWGGPPTRG
ncbi:hypothetical protein WJX84_007977, partial [Apatococcus fuscideae]